MLIAASAQGSTLDALIPEKYEQSTHLLIIETDTMEIVEACRKQEQSSNRQKYPYMSD